LYDLLVEVNGIVKIHSLSAPGLDYGFLIGFHDYVLNRHGALDERQTGVRRRSIAVVHDYFRLQYIRRFYAVIFAACKKRRPYGLRFLRLHILDGPVTIKSLIQHLDGLPITIMERPTQLTAQPLWHSCTRHEPLLQCVTYIFSLRSKETSATTDKKFKFVFLR